MLFILWLIVYRGTDSQFLPYSPHSRFNILCQTDPQLGWHPPGSKSPPNYQGYLPGHRRRGQKFTTAVHHRPAYSGQFSRHPYKAVSILWLVWIGQSLITRAKFTHPLNKEPSQAVTARGSSLAILSAIPGNDYFLLCDEARNIKNWHDLHTVKKQRQKMLNYKVSKPRSRVGRPRVSSIPVTGYKSPGFRWGSPSPDVKKPPKLRMSSSVVIITSDRLLFLSRSPYFSIFLVQINPSSQKYVLFLYFSSLPHEVISGQRRIK